MESDDFVPVELAALVINERADEQILYLREVDGTRQFPIVVGMFEAFAIDRFLKGLKSERPLTHDLIGRLVAVMGAEVTQVRIDDLKDDTFYAKLVLHDRDDVGDAEYVVDSRPSDAITIALKTDAPMVCAEHVLAAASGSGG